MSAQKEFYAKLTGLAAMCNFTLTPEVIRLYDSNLSAMGYEALCRALDLIICERRSRDAFPSIREIKAQINPELDPAAEANEAVGRIMHAISRIGPYNAAGAREHMGELAWRVVTLEGGWETVCELVDYENMPTLQAQWREMARAQVVRAKMGLDGQAPQLPRPKSEGGLTALGSGFDALLKRLPEMPS